MRDIIFRWKLKDTLKDTDEWIYGGYCEDTKTLRYPVFIPGKEIDFETVSQYTGVKDEDEIMVFEGDIVTFRKRGYAVEFDSGMFILRGLGYYPTITFSEVCHGQILVVGNIYDNPELLC